jgi:periplasmic protein TonB
MNPGNFSDHEVGRLRFGVQVALLACLVVCFAGAPARSQTEDAGATDRKLISRVEPKYPPTLERLYIGGVVRLQVDIAPNGSVESAQLLGGNPILGQSAIAAVKQWRYALAKTKTRTVVRLEFDPHK